MDEEKSKKALQKKGVGEDLNIKYQRGKSSLDAQMVWHIIAEKHIFKPHQLSAHAEKLAKGKFLPDTRLQKQKDKLFFNKQNFFTT